MRGYFYDNCKIVLYIYENLIKIYVSGLNAFYNLIVLL